MLPQESSRPFLIVLEGIDGTGKSTQARRLADLLRQRGATVLLDHEPTNGPWGQQLRASALTGRLSAAAELELFIQDRQQHVAEVISPALAAGHVVILDRYYFSNMAYQGAQGMDPEAIRCANESFAPVPDLLLLLDLPVDTALQRIHRRDSHANLFESRDNLQRCRDIFLRLRGEPYCHVIAADDDMETVFARMLAIVSNHPHCPSTPIS